MKKNSFTKNALCFSGLSSKDYCGRHVLLTGVTGFLGKVLFALLMERHPDVACIYLLMRPSKKRSVQERFKLEVLGSPVFSELTEDKQAQLKSFILSRVKVIEGDITLPGLGLAKPLAEHLKANLDVVFNVAGLVDFYPDIRQGLEINVEGALRVADFVASASKAHLLHFSTCYVAGKTQGMVDETIQLGHAPNGRVLDEEHELVNLKQSISASIQNHPSRCGLKKKLISLGRDRAQSWGWANTYCYTKALAERLLFLRYPQLSFSVLRPSIVESALQFPFPGWNEGLNGTAPLSKQLETHYPVFISKPDMVLDIVPVDVVCAAAIEISSCLFAKKARQIYQVSTSHTNPCQLSFYGRHLRKGVFKELWQSQAYVNLLLKLVLRPKYVGPNSMYSPQALIKLFTKLKSNLIALRIIKADSFFLQKTLRKLQSIDLMCQAYRPFTYEHEALFSVTNLSFLESKGMGLASLIHELDWESYLTHIHFYGLRRWLFPRLNRSTPMQKQTPKLTCSDAELSLLMIVGMGEATKKNANLDDALKVVQA